MMIDPEIIGYDEPTSALDPALRLEVEKLILQTKNSEWRKSLWPTI